MAGTFQEARIGEIQDIRRDSFLRIAECPNPRLIFHVRLTVPVTRGFVVQMDVTEFMECREICLCVLDFLRYGDRSGFRVIPAIERIGRKLHGNAQTLDQAVYVVLHGASIFSVRGICKGQFQRGVSEHRQWTGGVFSVTTARLRGITEEGFDGQRERELSESTYSLPLRTVSS